jgi:hypothetical protein
MSIPRIRISTPTDVLEAVPVLLRFYPTESLVGLFLDHTPQGAMLGLTARADLPTDEADTVDLAAGMADTLSRYAEGIFVLYTADQDEARATMRTLLERLDPSKVRLAVLATMLGWTTVDPERPDVIQWTNAYPTTTGTVAATLAEAGFYAMGTRDDIADSIKAPDRETAEDYALGRALDAVPTNPTADEMAEMTEEVHHWVTEYLRQPTTIIAEEAAYIAARLRFSGPRDEVFRLLDSDTSQALAALWQAVAGMTPDTDALPVLAVLALSAWVGRDGTLANVAIERAQTLPDGPGASLIALVNTLIVRQVHPALWDQYKRTL